MLFKKDPAKTLYIYLMEVSALKQVCHLKSDWVDRGQPLYGSYLLCISVWCIHVSNYRQPFGLTPGGGWWQKDFNFWICYGVQWSVMVLLQIACSDFSLVLSNPPWHWSYVAQPNFISTANTRESEELATISAHLDRQLYLLFSFHRPIKVRQLLHQIKWKTV